MTTGSAPTGQEGGQPAAVTLGDAPVRRQAPAATPAAPEGGAQPEGQQAPPVEYEHDFLKSIEKGRHKTFSEFSQRFDGLHKEMKRLQTAEDALKTRLGGWAGPPVGEDGKPRDYVINQSPESLATYGPIDTNTDEFKYINDIGKKFGAPEGFIQALFPLYEKIVGGNADGQADAVRQMLADKYGSAEEASAVTNDVWAWAEDRLGEDKRATIKRLLLSSPDTVPFLEMLMKAGDQAPIPHGSSSAPGPADTHQTMIEMKKKPDGTYDTNWSQDPAKAERWRRFTREQAAREDAAGGGKQTTERPLSDIVAANRGR